MQSNHPLDLNRRSEPLFLGRHLMDLADHIHALGHPAEYCESLAIGIPFAPKIKFGLVADADHKMMGSCIRSNTCHGQRAIQMS